MSSLFVKEKGKWKMNYSPLPHQKRFHECDADQLLLGGAAGPGKSYALRMDCYLFALSSPGAKIYLFRKSVNQLRVNHIDAAKIEVPNDLAEFNATNNTLKFKNGSIIYFCFCASDMDVTIYQGAEIHLLAVDEASHFTEFMHNYLRGRVRMGSFQPSEKDARFLPRIIYGSNPGDVGGQWLKKHFVSQGEPNEVFIDKHTALPERTDRDGNILPAMEGMRTIFIPCNFYANPHIDPSYERQFSGLPPEQIKALVHGDFDAAVGQALFNLSADKHMVPDFFSSPDFRKAYGHFTTLCAYDHGSASPGAVIWAIQPDQDLELNWRERNKKMFIPADSIIIVKEWFIASENSDSAGLKLNPDAIARKILEIEKENHLNPDIRVSDYSIRTSEGGPSIEQHFCKHGIFFRMAKKNRIMMYNEIINRLAGSPTFRQDGRTEQYPSLYISEACEAWWRLTPGLVLDEKNPEKGIAKNKQQNDHLADATMYMLMEKAFSYSPQDRIDREYDSYREQYMQARQEVAEMPADPYAW